MNNTEGNNTMSSEDKGELFNEVYQTLSSKMKEELDMRQMLFEENNDFKNNLLDMTDVGSVVIHCFDRGYTKLNMDITDYSKDKFRRFIEGMVESLRKDECNINGCLTDSGNGNKIIFVVSDLKMLRSHIVDKYRKEVN